MRVFMSGSFGVALVLAMATPAVADPWGGVVCDPSSGQCEVTAGDSGKEEPNGDSAGSTSGGDDCYYVQNTTDGKDVSDAVADKGGEDGDWYVRRCGDESSLVWLKDPPKVPPKQVAHNAAAKLQLPPVDIRVSPDGPQLVGLPSWLWLETGSWAGQTATAATGAVSVTATARPVQAVWTMGDGSTVVCEGPGTPFSAEYPPDAESVDCGHTYQTSSLGEAGGAFAISVRVTWEVSWSGAGKSGVVPDMTTTATDELTVREVHTLLTD